MRVARRCGAAAIALVMLAGCTSQAVHDAIERSSAPLLVPEGEWRERFEFTAPPGSTDLYQLRWNFRAGATDVVTGWQVASTSTYEAAKLAEGPGQALVDEALMAARGEGCTLAEPDSTLQICFYDAEFARGGVNAYLVRLVQNHILVIDYNNLGGDRTTFNPDDLAARFISADFEAVPIDGTIDDYLVTVF